MNKKFLIVFTDSHLPYSPSVLNIFEGLKAKGNQVDILTIDPPQYYAKDKIQNEDVIYLQDKSSLPWRVYHKVLNKILKKLPKLRTRKQLLSSKANVFIKEIKKKKADIIIAVDFFALWCVQQTNQRAYFFSLEIYDDDVYYLNCDLSKIDLAIIQSVERYTYLFPTELKIPYFIYPNSPAYIDINPEAITRKPTDLIFCGSAVPDFGIISILDFLMDYPEYNLTIKGTISPGSRQSIYKFYSTLLEENRLFINEDYMDFTTLTQFVSKFRIGFVFYDFYRYDHLRRFNYYTAPSGKLFQYLNSGVPIIANNIDGFHFIEENNAGKLIPYISTLQIKMAIDYINSNYTQLTINSKLLSRKYDNTVFTNELINKYF